MKEWQHRGGWQETQGELEAAPPQHHRSTTAAPPQHHRSTTAHVADCRGGLPTRAGLPSQQSPALTFPAPYNSPLQPKDPTTQRLRERGRLLVTVYQSMQASVQLHSQAGHMRALKTAAAPLCAGGAQPHHHTQPHACTHSRGG